MLVIYFALLLRHKEIGTKKTNSKLIGCKLYNSDPFGNYEIKVVGLLAP